MTLPAEVRQFRQMGFDAPTAGNLVAHSHGIRPAKSGWTARELAHLDFERWYFETHPDPRPSVRAPWTSLRRMFPPVSVRRVA